MENKITVKELLKRRPDCKSFVEELVSDALASEDGILFRMAGGWSDLNPEEEWMEIENELYPKFLDEFLKWSADIPVRMGDDENLSYQLENIMDDFVEEVEDKYGDMAQDMIDKALKDMDESRRPRGRMLREGTYNEGKRVWKITAIADNDYEDDVVRYFRTEKAADEAYEDMSKDNTYKFVEEPEEYVIQYNDDIEAEPNYWMDGTVSWIEGDYDFGDYTVEVDGGLPTIAMKFNYNNDYADEDNEIFLQGIDAEIAVNEICDIYSNGDKTPKEAVELWSRQYA